MTGYNMKNKYLLIRPMDKKRLMGNGVTLTIEEQDKKSIVNGTIVAACSGNNAYTEGSIVIFPLYAADIFKDDEHGLLWIVKSDDIMMAEKI